MKAHFILHVADQKLSALFHERVLGRKPRLDVPGMTEFELSAECVLGLMPVAGIKRLLGELLPDPEGAKGVPRAELYLLVDDPAASHRLALESNARRNLAHSPAAKVLPAYKPK